MTKATSRTLLLAVLALLTLIPAIYFRARAQVLVPRSEDLRYQALLNEPIATLDRRSVVAGTSALLVRDRVTGQCFLAVTVGNSIGLSPAACER